MLEHHNLSLNIIKTGQLFHKSSQAENQQQQSQYNYIVINLKETPAVSKQNLHQHNIQRLQMNKKALQITKCAFLAKWVLTEALDVLRDNTVFRLCGYKMNVTR